MSQLEVLEERKVLQIARTAAKCAKMKRLYFEQLRALNATVPASVRSATAKYAANIKKALRGELSPEELGAALLEMKKEWRSWKAENAEQVKVVSALAKEFYKALKELETLTEGFEQ